GHGHDRVFAHRHGVAPALQRPRRGRHVVRIGDPFAGGAAGLGEADQQVGMAVAADFLFIHVGQQEILGLGVGVGRAGVQVAR
ncbi:hypothetical protein UN67_17920, partial [Vibrio cholerae O1 biovar El Tor]